MRVKKIASRLAAVVLTAAIAASGIGSMDVYAEKRSSGKIVVDYNTSIGTGTPELFGGVGTPSCLAPI